MNDYLKLGGGKRKERERLVLKEKVAVQEVALR
jgi:hypothetical protein